MIIDFKIFPTMLLRQLNFGRLSVWQLFYACYKEKMPLSFNLYFLLLLSKTVWSPEICLTICYPRASCLKTGSFSKKCVYVKDSISSKQLNSHKENKERSNIFRNKYTKKKMADHRYIKNSNPKWFSIFRKSVAQSFYMSQRLW